jgi:hypothetical protein
MGKPYTWYTARRKSKVRAKKKYTSIFGFTKEQSLAILQRGYVNIGLHVEWLTPEELTELVKNIG